MFEKTWGSGQDGHLVFADAQADGDIVVMGSRRSQLYPYLLDESYMAGLSAQGTITWERRFGNAYSNVITKVIRTRWNTYLVIGSQQADQSYGHHVTAMHVDADGNILWSSSYYFYYSAHAVDICETDDYGFCILISVNSGTETFPAIIKIDQSGNELWRKPQEFWPGWTPHFIAQFAGNEFLVYGNMDTGHFNNTFIAKFDAFGNVGWVKTPCGVNDTIQNIASGLLMYPGGNFDILFHTDAAATPGIHAELFSYDSTGTHLSTVLYPFPLNFISHDSKNEFVFATGLENDHPEIYAMGPDKTFQQVAMVDQPGVVSNRAFRYMAPLPEGGFLGVGKAEGSSGRQFYLASFSPKGQIDPEDFSVTVQAYPNPSVDGLVNLSFDVTEEKNIRVNIFSADGRLVYERRLFCPTSSHTVLTVNLDEQAAAGGMYILEARTDVDIYRKKLIIARPK